MYTYWLLKSICLLLPYIIAKIIVYKLKSLWKSLRKLKLSSDGGKSKMQEDDEKYKRKLQNKIRCQRYRDKKI